MIINSKIKPAILNLEPYHPGKSINEVQRELGIQQIIKLASNENPFGISPKVIKIIHEEAAQLRFYPDESAFLLKKAIGKAKNVEPSQIVLGNGSNEIFTLIQMTFGCPNDAVLLSEYAFASYAIAAKTLGLQLQIAKTHDFQQSLENILMCIDSKTKIIFLANPNNPTGSWHNRYDLKNWLENIPPHIIVVIDQAYYEFMQHLSDYPDAAEWINAHPNLIVTYTFSKAYGLAGLRLGYALCSSSVANLLNRCRLPFNVNGLAQIAGVTALTDLEHLNKTLHNNIEGLQYYVNSLTKLKLHYLPPSGNFITIQIPNAQKIYDYLLNKGIIVRCLASYKMPEFLRISVGNKAENLQCVTELKTAINVQTNLT